MRQARNARPVFAARHERGVAAIEFVLVMPVLITLFFGVVNLTHYYATRTRLDATAELVADLVARRDLKTTTAENIDAIMAAQLMFAPRTMADVGLRVLIFNYFKVGTNPTQIRWQRDSAMTGGNPTTPCAPPDPASANIANKLGTGRDVIAAVVCITYSPPAAGQVPFLNALPPLRKETAIATYQSPTLTCSTNPC